MNINRNTKSEVQKRNLYTIVMSGIFLIFLPAGIVQAVELTPQVQALEKNYNQDCGSARAKQAYGRALAKEYQLGNVPQSKYNTVVNEYKLLKKKCLESRSKYHAALAKLKGGSVSKPKSTSIPNSINLLGEKAPPAVLKKNKNVPYY
jgi:hypothetical protein